MFIKIKLSKFYFLALILFLFNSIGLAEEDEVYLKAISDQIQVITKDLKTLEKAVYEKSDIVSSTSSNSINSDGLNEDIMTKHLLKLNGIEDQFRELTNKSSLTTASRATLRKQATFLRKNKKLNVTIEGHADERGTREYNLALGERRANAAKDYLMTYGISGKRITVISYGKEKPINASSTPLAWSQNRRSVTVKVN